MGGTDATDGPGAVGGVGEALGEALRGGAAALALNGGGGGGGVGRMRFNTRAGAPFAVLGIMSPDFSDANTTASVGKANID